MLMIPQKACLRKYVNPPMFIGAGSFGFTRRLPSDLLTVPEFSEIEVAFTDISPDNLRVVTRLCQWSFSRRWRMIGKRKTSCIQARPL